ncbi:peptide-binding protein [bacterium]|nr:peptide-binding protein [bacterium]
MIVSVVMADEFTPPALTELDAKASWVDRPVVNTLEKLTKHLQAKKRLASDAEVLALKNDSKENNAKILSTLGRQPIDPKEVNWNAAWNRRMGGEVKSVNPILFSSVSEADLGSYINLGLFSFDWELQPLAAEESVKSWQSSADGLYDKVVLRDDMTWSDGSPITAHDIAFSYRVILDPRVPALAVRAGTEELLGVHAYDDRTVVFFHKAAKATNVWNINFPIIPKHIFEKTYPADPSLAKSPEHVAMETNPISGGPYTIVYRQRGSEIVLERRESYYMHQGKQVREKPYFKTIRFRVIEDSNTALLAVKSGDVDETNLVPEQWIKQTDGSDFYKRNTKVKEVEWTSWHIVWNLQNPLFKDKKVRRALAYAFDYNELLERLSYNLYEPSSGPFHRESWMAPRDYPAPYQQNIDRAEELLEEAGWTDSDGDGVLDKDGIKFEFDLNYRSDPIIERYCNVARESFENVGINCNLRPLEFTVLVEKLSKHEFQAAFGGWGTGTDPDTYRNIIGTDQLRNYGSYSNPEVDKLFDQGASEFDRTKRGEIYGRIHRQLFEDQPYLYLYWRSSFYAFNKDLRGYFMSPRGPYNYGPGAGALWRVAAP